MPTLLIISTLVQSFHGYIQLSMLELYTRPNMAAGNKSPSTAIGKFIIIVNNNKYVACA